MVQESIVEYINSQTKAGISRDAIKATLTGAGWQVVDVEDTLKKIEAGKTVAAAVAQPMSVMPASSPAAKPAGPGPQTIKVSDLVSSSTSSAPVIMASKPAGASPATSSTSAQRSPLTGPAAMASAVAPAGTKTPNTVQAQNLPTGKAHASRGALITDIILVVIILAVAGFAGFLYMQNGSLSKQLSSLNGTSSGVNSQLSALQAQVAASTTALTAQVSTLTTETQELQTELSFYSVPPGSAAGATITASFSGTVSGGGKASYVVTGMYGAKVYVANSKLASVISALAPLMATTPSASTSTASSTTASSTTTTASTPATPAATAQFTGTYVPGSDMVTLTEVNGTAL